MKRLFPKDFVANKYGLSFRFVNEGDAEFIYLLRSDPQISRYIHDIEGGVENQRQWIRKYKEREDRGEEYYFIFYRGEKKVGLCRIYSIKGTTFTSGSWVMVPDSSMEDIMAVPVITREFAFETLGLEFEDNYDACHVDNKKVIKFNLSFGCKIYKHFQDVKGEYVAMSLTKEDFELNKPKLLKRIGY